MAILEKRGDSFRVIFYYRSQRFARSLKTDKEKTAVELQRRLEGNLTLLEQGRLEYIPDQDDLATLLLSDGKLNARPQAVKRLTLGEFLERYQANLPPGKEPRTYYIEGLQFKHLKRLIGERTPLAELPNKLQGYVDKRSKEPGRRGEPVSPVTIKKELSSLTSIWNKWGMRQKLVDRPLSLRYLEYPKSKEKAAFQTWQQIEKKAKGDKTSPLWDSVYLSLQEVAELLDFVKEKELPPFVYPMFVMATNTGARRSEILRAQVDDFDLEAGVVTIREKKKDRSKVETYRQVPMTPLLRQAMKAWLDQHPGGEVAFCKEAGKPLSAQLAHHHIRWALDGSKWEVIRGWHAFRHSFVSNLACKGIDERVIMKLAGHLNPQTTRRYQHLFPSTVQDAMDAVFRDGKLPVAEPK